MLYLVKDVMRVQNLAIQMFVPQQIPSFVFPRFPGRPTVPAEGPAGSKLCSAQPSGPESEGRMLNVDLFLLAHYTPGTSQWPNKNPHHCEEGVWWPLRASLKDSGSSVLVSQERCRFRLHSF